MVFASEKAQATYEAGIFTAYYEGKDEGRIEIAKSLLRLNTVQLSDIATATGLSIDELNALKEEIGL